jgi:Bacterial transcriptional activator domain
MVEENRAHDEHPSPGIYPIQFVQVGTLPDVPAPLARISTCGGMSIEVLHEVLETDPPQGRYVVVTPQQRRLGSTTGLNLLSALVSLPGRYAAKSWLMERLSRSKSEEDEDEIWAGMVRVDNIVTLLRGLLCPPGIAGEKELRKALVSYVPNHFESGPGYLLAGEPLIWLDVDVIEASVKEACLLEQQRQDALPFWERASVLAARGGYLLDERYSDWAESKRREVEGYQRQAVHALHRLYLVRDDGAAEEQVLFLLRSYWQTHPTDEDVLRPLLELLGKRGCVQEAEEYYQHLCQELEMEGLAPHPRTQRIIQYVHDGQSTAPYTIETKSRLNATTARISSLQDGMYAPFSHMTKQDIIEATNRSEKTRIAQPSGMQDMEPSRRNFLQTLGILGAEALLPPLIQGDSSFAENRSLNFSQASVANLATITSQFRTMQRRGDVFISNGIYSHVQTIQEALEQTINDKTRRELWKVFAQTQTIAGFNPMKKTKRGRAKTFLEAAVASAQNSGDALLVGASLGHLAHFSLREEQNAVKAEQFLRHAQEYVPAGHPLKGWFALVMASIAAKEGHKQECEVYLIEATTIVSHLPQTSDFVDLYFTDFSLTSVHIFAVNCWLVIGNAMKAYDHLIEMSLEDLADNRRASAYCDASNVCAMMGEFEMAQRLAFQAIDKASATLQQYVIPRCMVVAQAMNQKKPDTSYAAAIAEYAHLALRQS